ncbi:MAG: hypothetical protein ACYCW6_19025 [Candidatus Xenobia bacterium]
MLLFLVLLTRAAGATPTMEVAGSVGRAFKYDRAVPISVRLSNPGDAPFEGQVQVELPSNNYQRVLIHAPVTLAPGARRAITLPLPAPAQVQSYYLSNGLLTVRLTSHGQTVLERTLPLRSLFSRDFLVLVVSPGSSGFDYLHAMPQQHQKQASMSGQTVVEDATADVLPAHWIGFSSCDLVVLNHVAALKLSADQERALADWVHTGGTLLLVSGLDPSEFHNSLLEPLLPAPLLQTATLAGVTLQQLDVSHCQVLMKLGPSPLLVGARRGLGQVLYCAADVGTPHVLSRQVSAGFWKTVFKSAPRAPVTPILTDAHLLDKAPEIQPPSFGFLAAFLFVYVMVVGPLNFWLLRRLDRVMLAYVTIPALALLFAGVCFGLSYASKGAQVILRCMSVSYLSANGDATAFTHTWTSLFSPSQATYTLSFAPRTAACIVQNTISTTQPHLDLEYGDGLRYRDVGLEMWSLGRFRTDSVVTWPGGVVLALKTDGPQLSGTITSRLGGVPFLGVVLSNSSLSPALTLQDGMLPVDVKLQPINGSLEQSLKSAFGLKSPDDDARIDAMHQFAEEYSHNHDNQPMLVAWWPQAIGAPQLDHPPRRKIGSTLLLVH